MLKTVSLSGSKKRSLLNVNKSHGVAPSGPQPMIIEGRRWVGGYKVKGIVTGFSPLSEVITVSIKSKGPTLALRNTLKAATVEF